MAEPAQEVPWWMTEKPPSSQVFEPAYVVPAIAELVQMPAAIRGKHIEQVILHDQEKGTQVYQDYLRLRDQCTYTDEDGRRCTKQRWENATNCLQHAPLDQLDPTVARARRTSAAKLRMLELLEKGVDQLETMINAPDEAITPGVRLNAITVLFDRVGLPKEQNQTVQAHIITEDYTAQGDVVRERLKLLTDSYVNSQLTAIEQGEQSETIEGEVADEHPDQ